MSQLSTLMNELNPIIADRKTSSERIEGIITQHAIGSAAAGLAAGVLPGIGGVIATLSSAGVIWSMYYRICRELDIQISQNVLKTLGSAFLTNIITQLGGVLLIEFAASCIPGLALITSSAICYAITYLAGYLFIKLLINVFKAGKDPNTMTASELASISKATSAEIDCKQIFKQAQADAKNRIKRGEITKDDTIDQ